MLSPYCQLYIIAYNIQYIVGAMAVPRPVLGFQDTLQRATPTNMTIWNIFIQYFVGASLYACPLLGF
jgi:hypothetical protein